MIGGAGLLPLIFAFAVVAFFYATVGHGGATGYAAIAVLAGLAPHELRGIILVCNVLVAGNASIQFHRAGFPAGPKLLPLAAASMPAAYLGARIPLKAETLSLLLGGLLLLAAFRFLTLRTPVETGAFARSGRVFFVLPLVGALLGFLAGLTGIGGGIFLSPLILSLGWADAKRTAALSSAFIALNSGAALLAFPIGGFSDAGFSLALAASALAGGLAGARWGSEKLSYLGLQRVLGIVLLAASFRMLREGFV